MEEIQAARHVIVTPGWVTAVRIFQIIAAMGIVGIVFGIVHRNDL